MGYIEKKPKNSSFRSVGMAFQKQCLSYSEGTEKNPFLLMCWLAKIAYVSLCAFHVSKESSKTRHEYTRVNGAFL